MNILVEVDGNAGTYILICLINKLVCEKMCRLITEERYYEAILEVLKSGSSFQAVSVISRKNIKADLILTAKSAHWDLTI